MPETDGLTLQSHLAKAQPNLTVIIMTAYASVTTAVRALKAGAYDYVTKPFDPDELSHLVSRALEHRSLRTENIRLKQRLTEVSTPQPILGRSPAMQQILDMISSVATTDSTVLIKGESGTGKELVAHAIHASSARRFGPMIVVNCGALAEGILESELFGHEKGSFTGAHKQHKGKFELADGGTIFLDEIGAVSQRVQVELLRVLEDKVVNRLGGKSPIAVDFRVIAATNQDLESLIQSGEFREDLFWRINVFTIDIPPLRLRPEDTVLLAEHFLERLAKAMNRKPMALSNQAIQAIKDYSWPGNVRELQNAIERAVVLSSPPTVELKDLPLRVTRVTHQHGPLSLAEVERVHILSILDGNRWNISQTARILGVDRGTLYSKLEKYGLSRPAAKP
jgi:DNA-binding NtrC family response regulator